MKKVGIIGAGISGLFIANLFRGNSNYQVTIFDKKKEINLKEGYGIQLSVNSIKLLNKIDFDKFQKNKKFNPNNINFYSNKNFDKICDLDISNFNFENCKYTTLKRSDLIYFLKKNIEHLLKTNHSISKIDQEKQLIRLTFENHETFECDYLIISDGVFSKGKSLISNNQNKPKYNNTLAIRAILRKLPENIDNKNISLFLDSNFHYVIYPVNPNGDFNFIAIMKYNLSEKELKNFSLFSDNLFVKKVLEKIPLKNKDFLNNLKEIKIFPVFASNDFFHIKNKNIHLIGDAFFAFPPSFAQGASQSIESAHEVFESIKNNTKNIFFENRVNKTKMVNIRSKFNEFAFHFSNPITVFFRNIFLKRLVKNKKFLETYLGKIYND